MRKIISYVFFLFLIGAIGVFIYWQQNKKKIVKAGIQKALNKKTENLYYIHYDSSRIDEINGTAAFYHISLQSDSIQKEILERKDSLPPSLFNIKADEVKAVGIDVAGLLEKSNVTAKKILINKPVIHIINTGKHEQSKDSHTNDTLALYQKILGRFKTIEADTIQINNGTILLTDISGKPLTTIENINIKLNNFLVDSTRNYENIVSYFITDIRLTVENIQLPPSSNGSRINITKLDYDAAERTLKAGEIQQYQENNLTPVIDLKNISLTGLSTASFILKQQFKADAVTCDGGLLTIYKGEKIQANKNKTIQLSSDLIDEVQVGSVELGKTKIVVINNLNPGSAPFILNDVEFTATKLLRIIHGSAVSDIVNNAEWKLRSSGFSLISNNQLYKLTASAIDVDKKKSVATIHKMSMIPLLREEEFMRRKTVQGDRYEFNFNEIQLQQVDLGKLLNENRVEAENVSMQPILKIYNDRTLPYDTTSKLGRYPYQLLQKLNIPLYINKLNLHNGYIAYKEKGRKSALTGNVFFSKINATIENLTNIAEKKKVNPNCRVVANALFLGSGKLTTEWRLPLTSSDSSFTAIGELDNIAIPDLNNIIVPLGMASIKKGAINSLKFNVLGTDYHGDGEVIFLYNDLHIELLKKDGDEELKTKDLATFLANLAIKNNNPQNGNIRPGKIDFDRDINKSFFNLLWKSIFTGVKNAAK